MEDENILKIVMAAGSALTGGVVVLFKVVMKQSGEQVKMSEKIGNLEGKHAGIKQLSAEVLEVVHRAASAPKKDK